VTIQVNPLLLKGLSGMKLSVNRLKRHYARAKGTGVYSGRDNRHASYLSKEDSSFMFGRTKKEIRIHRKFQKGIRTVEVDRGEIEQVLLNLVYKRLAGHA